MPRNISLPVSKIAVLRANGLGDFIFVLPALQRLRHVFPKAEIIYLGCPWHQDFLRGRPSPVNRVVAIPPSRGIRMDKPSAAQPVLYRFFQEMRQEQFDLAFQLHGGGRYSNPFLQAVGAKKTVGLQADDAPPLDVSVRYVYYQNEYLRYLEAVSPVVGLGSSISPRLTLTQADLAAASAVFNFHVPYAVIHPGASDPRRRWPAAAFAVVGDWLVSRGYQVVLTGSTDESAIVDAVIRTMNHPAHNLCSRLSLSALTGLVSHGAVVVANDTGPYHLAVALDTPAVGIFWCGNLINAAPLFRSRHRTVASWQIHCPLCREDVASPGFPFKKSATGCDHLVSFVASVSPAEVIGQIEDILIHNPSAVM